MLIVDTREKKNCHVTSYFSRMGVEFESKALRTGDYMTRENPGLVIDRKQSLQEVYSNLVGQQHARFRRELQRAQEDHQRLIVLVETWPMESVGSVWVQEPDILCLDDVAKWRNPREVQFYKRVLLATRDVIPWNPAWPDDPPITSQALMRVMQSMARTYGVEWQFCRRTETGKTICKILGAGVDNGADM